jgi:hypothetical protein
VAEIVPLSEEFPPEPDIEPPPELVEEFPPEGLVLPLFSLVPEQASKKFVDAKTTAQTAVKERLNVRRLEALMDMFRFSRPDFCSGSRRQTQ